MARIIVNGFSREVRSMPQFSAADPIVILSYARTPMGGMQGALSDVSALPISL